MRGNFILYFLELVIIITSGVVMFDNNKVDLERSLLVIFVAYILHAIASFGLVCNLNLKRWIMMGASVIATIITSVALGIVYFSKDGDDKPLSQNMKYAVLGVALIMPVINLVFVPSNDNLYCKSSSVCLKGEIQQVKNAIRDYRAYEEGHSSISALSKPVDVETELTRFKDLQKLQSEATEIIGDDVGLNCKKFADLIKAELLSNKKVAAQKKITGIQGQLAQAKANPQPILTDAQRQAAQQAALIRMQRMQAQQADLGDVEMQALKN